MEVTLKQVLDFIETTPALEDLPTISDALTNRFADELGLYIEAEEEAKEEAEDIAEEAKKDEKEEEKETLPPISF
jgi:hypothetical protein